MGKGQNKQDLYTRELGLPEYQVQIARLLLRMVDHADAITDGLDYRIDDLASVLRTLIGRGKGNDALAGLFRRMKLPQPTLFVNATPPAPPHVHLSYGSVPVNGPGPSNDEITFVELQSRVVAYIVGPQPGEPARPATWAALVEAYGNTWGSHLSGTVPYHLERVELNAAGDLSLGVVLLIQLARAIHHAVSIYPWAEDLGYARVPEPRTPDFGIAGCLITFDEATRGLEIYPRLAERDRRPYAGEVILTTTIAGYPARFSWAARDRLKIELGESTILSDPVIFPDSTSA